MSSISFVPPLVWEESALVGVVSPPFVPFSSGVVSIGGGLINIWIMSFKPTS